MLGAPSSEEAYTLPDKSWGAGVPRTLGAPRKGSWDRGRVWGKRGLSCMGVSESYASVAVLVENPDGDADTLRGI